MIDDAHGLCEIAGQLYYTSEALHAIDAVAYSEEAVKLKAQRTQPPQAAGEARDE